MLLGQPVEEVGRVTGQDFIIVECGDGLDALLELLQTRLYALHLHTASQHTRFNNTDSTHCRLPALMQPNINPAGSVSL